jgi:ribonuclease PH
LTADGRLDRNPIKDHVAAVSVGMVGGRALLDLDYVEDSGCDSDLNIVMTGTGGFVEVQGTAEGQTFDRDTLGQLLDLAHAGIGQLIQAQRDAL